jgi:glycosyltransferase involved in cell wall biosynthesis
MLIAFDGGAFQAGRSEGIRGCAIGLLNAAAQIDPSFRVVLVADPRLGAIRPEAVARLQFEPEIVYGEIAAGGDPPPRGLLTDNPDIRFLVDDTSVAAQCEGGWAWYDGPPPRRLFAIASRAARPCDVGDSSDLRPLGVAVAQIAIDDRENPPRLIEYGDPQLEDGFYSPEGEWRWTTGRGVVPLALFPEAETVRVGVRLGPGHRYRVGGSFDRAFNRLEAELRKRSHRLALSRLASELTARGARVYVANHYLPAAIPGLKIAAWAYDSEHHPELLLEADCVLSIAERLSRELTAELGVAAERILTIGAGVAPELPPSEPAAIAQIRQRYAIAGDYILCVGMLDPRQSHLRLIQAYHQVVEAMGAAPDRAPPSLVIVGQPGSGYQPMLREISERGLGERVKLLTDLGPDGLAALYSDALFVAYPSLYEGFRPTLLDAMAYRKPVLTAQASIMSELAGDAALLVDLDDVGSIADGLARLAGDAELRAELVRRDDERRNTAHWPSIARSVLDRLNALIDA